MIVNNYHISKQEGRVIGVQMNSTKTNLKLVTRHDYQIEIQIKNRNG